MTLNQEMSLRELDAAIIREAADVLQAIGTSGVNLPENWRWPLIDELAGISAALAARAEPQAGECPYTTRCDCIGACKHGFAGNGAAPSPASRARPEAQGAADQYECRVILRDGFGEWHKCSREQYDHIRLTGFYNGPGGAQCEARALYATPPADRAPGEVTVLEVGFKYENGVNVPTVLVGFAPEDWAARDRFAASITHQEPAR